jgi:hypothetical protein
MTKSHLYGDLSPHTTVTQAAGFQFKAKKSSAFLKAKRHHLSRAAGFRGS